jgi:hypothetical protein
MRKSLAALPVLLVLTMSQPARADQSGPYDQPGVFGVGLAANDYMIGPSIKAFISGPWAFQLNTGLGYYPGLYGFVLDADALYEFPRFLSIDALSLNWYLGAGGTFGYSSSFPFTGFGNRTALYGGGQTLGGVGLQFRKVPIEVVFELQTTFLGVGSNEGGPQSAYFYFVFGAGFAGRYFF